MQAKKRTTKDLLYIISETKHINIIQHIITKQILIMFENNKDIYNTFSKSDYLKCSYLISVANIDI